LVETWNGSAWSVIPSPSPGSEGNSLSGVSCRNATHCIAVGDYLGVSGDQALVEALHGHTWSVIPSRDPGGLGDYLSGVSCSSVWACVAVGGSSANGSSSPQTLVVSRDGRTGSITPSPDPGSIASLSSVSCAGPTDKHGRGDEGNAGRRMTHVFHPDCISGGVYSSPGTPDDTLVESWDGARWSVMPTPDASGLTNNLSGIACIGASDCVTVGSAVTTIASATLVESWDGSTWSITPSPNPSSVYNDLFSVTCRDASDCVAVGAFDDSGTYQTLIETGSLEPSTGTPEAPLPLLLPVAGVCIFVGVCYSRRRASVRDRPSG
jgi:hypothetical protein